MLASQSPMQVLQAQERNAPTHVDQISSPFSILDDNLVSLHKIEQRQKTAPMDPNRQHLNIQRSLIPIPQDPLLEKNPQHPEPHYNNGLQRQRNEMQSRQ